MEPQKGLPCSKYKPISQQFIDSPEQRAYVEGKSIAPAAEVGIPVHTANRRKHAGPEAEAVREPSEKAIPHSEEGAQARTRKLALATCAFCVPFRRRTEGLNA